MSVLSEPHDFAALLDKGRDIKVGAYKYVVTGYVGNGGTGEVYRCADEAGRDYALKLYLPINTLFHAQTTTAHAAPSSNTEIQLFVDQAINFATHEYQSLHKLDHPAVVDVVDVGDLTLKSTEKRRLPQHLRQHIKTLPLMISEYVRGRNLDTLLRDHQVEPDALTNALAEIAGALDYIHQENLLHADVRATNIMISDSAGQPVLVDFASTKDLDIANSLPMDRTLLAIDTALLSPNLPANHPLRERRGLYELSRGALRTEYFPWIDTMQFAMLLRHVSELNSDLFDAGERDYLDLLIETLDYPGCVQWASKPLKPLVERLGSLHSYPFGVPELVAPSVAESTISLVSGITVPMSGIIEGFAGNRSFERLTRINQLSLLGLVYPAANYSRSVHALHTFEVARQMVLQLFGTPIFRSIFDRTSSQQLLVCALLHDMNHFPFLHTLQEARSVSGEPLISNDIVLDLFCNGEATGERRAGEPSIYELLERVEISPERFKRLIFGDHEDQPTAVDQVINSVISSNVDVDKMSYLQLDSIFTGVRYGQGIDVPALMKAALVALVGDRFHLAFDIRALPAMESVFLARYWNFRTIYWHHTNRAIMSMVLSVVRDLYVGPSQDAPLEFLRASIRLDDLTAARWIDDRFAALEIGPQSILRPLIESRRGLYKRLFTARPQRRDDDEAKLASDLKKLVTGPDGYQREIALCDAVGERIATRFRVEVGSRDVLLDVPRRNLGDRGGAAFVVMDGGPRRLEEASRSVEAVWEDFDLFSQRSRFFISPRISEVITKNVRNERRGEIRSDISDAIREVRTSNSSRKGVS